MHPLSTGDAEVRTLLGDGEIAVEGRMPYSSNHTFLVSVSHDDVKTLAVYKPGRGERPLWDFPPGLYRREVAAYELSNALGWGLVPATVLRRDAPLGEGSLQAFIEADFEEHYYTLVEDEQYHDVLKAICLFDVLANSCDRKSGHCVVDANGRVWAIDNGLSFHAETKLRTVIWEFGGEPMPESRLTDVERLVQGAVPDALARLLQPDECAALLARARAVLEARRFPINRSGRQYPWPLV